MCGFDWQTYDKRQSRNADMPKTKITKIYQSCPYCDAVGDQRDGLCELHAKVNDLANGIRQSLSFRNGENDLIIYQGADNFIVSILNTLDLDDQLRKGWENYRQKISERIKKLTFEEPEPEPEQEEAANAVEEVRGVWVIDW